MKGRGRGLTEGTVREGLKKTITSAWLDLANALPSRLAARRMGTQYEYSQLLRSQISYQWSSFRGPYKVVVMRSMTPQ